MFLGFCLGPSLLFLLFLHPVLSKGPCAGALTTAPLPYSGQGPLSRPIPTDGAGLGITQWRLGLSNSLAWPGLAPH